MTKALYPKTKARMQRALLDMEAVTIRLILLDSTYVYSASHAALSDIAAGARVKISNPLSSKTVNMTTGAFDSDDPTAEAVTGDNIEALALFVDSGVESTSYLVHYQNEDINTVPFTPDGSDIRILVPAGGWYVL